jgi:transcriptional regulator with XRE-family HTH domain
MAERRSAGARAGAGAGAAAGAGAGAAAGDDLESEAIALAFGATVRALRLHAGISLNELARRAGVDPAYIHRIESRGAQRPPLPRRPVVVAIAAALGSDVRQTDQLLALAGHTPAALLELGGWDATLASVAELLADPAVSGPAKAEFREVVRVLARRWARGNSSA